MNFDTASAPTDPPWPKYCSNRRMTAGITKHEQVVRIRKPGNYDRWKGSKELFCIACGWRVIPHRRSDVFCRHAADEDSDRPHTKPQDDHLETYQHRLLKYWARDELQQLGASDVVVEKHRGTGRPDVSGRVGNRLLAVEVQWSRISKPEIHQRTSQLRQAGCDVVWLMRYRDHLASHPTIAVDDFDPEDNHYTYSAGLLVPDSYSEVLAPGDKNSTLSSFFELWVGNLLMWGRYEPHKGGWALLDDWHRHQWHLVLRVDELSNWIIDQENMIADQSELIAGHEIKLGRLKEYAENCSERLAEAHGKIEELCTELARARAKSGGEIARFKAQLIHERNLRNNCEQRAKKAAYHAERWASVAVIAIIVIVVAVGVFIFN
jgi:hypothetical protein